MSNGPGGGEHRKVYVQYGCGLCAPHEWLNFDASPRLIIERLPGISILVDALGGRLFPRNINYGDIVRGLPVNENSVDAVYASHILEHLSRNDVERALANTFRILRAGGVFRLIVPDLEWRIQRYNRNAAMGRKDSADEFLKTCHIGEMHRARGLIALLRAAFGNSSHRWMYDFALMSYLLTEAGFVTIRRCEFNDSGDPIIDKVEERDRFYESGERELALAARKPSL